MMLRKHASLVISKETAEVDDYSEFGSSPSSAQRVVYF
jgi:hypothetical protein